MARPRADAVAAGLPTLPSVGDGADLHRPPSRERRRMIGASSSKKKGPDPTAHTPVAALNRGGGDIVVGLGWDIGCGMMPLYTIRIGPATRSQ